MSRVEIVLALKSLEKSIRKMERKPDFEENEKYKNLFIKKEKLYKVLEQIKK